MLIVWGMFMQMSIMKQTMEDEFQKQFNQLEEDVMVLLNQKDKALSDMAKQTEKRVREYDTLVIYMRHFCAWLVALVMWKAEAEIRRLQLRQEDELAQMVALQQHFRFKIVSHMGEKYIILLQRSVKAVIWTEWTLNLRVNRAVKLLVVDLMENISDLKDMISECEAKVGIVMNRLDTFAENTRNRKINHRILTQWYFIVKTTKMFFQEMARQAELEKNIVHLRVNVTEKATAMLARMQADLDTTELRITGARCFQAWVRQTNCQRLLGVARDDMREMKLLYDRELHGFQRDATEYRLKAAEAAAQNSLGWNDKNDVATCFTLWRNFVLAQLHIKSYSVLNDELDKLNQKHKVAMDQLHGQDELTQAKMLNFITHVQNKKQGDSALIRQWDIWKQVLYIEKKDHRKIVAKDQKKKRDHGACSGLFVLKKLTNEENEIILQLFWAWWLLDVFEGQMVKEIRIMREKHQEDVQFA